MREEFKALHELQQLDSQVLEIEQSAAQIPKKIGAIEEEVDVLRSRVGLANTELQSLKKEVGDLEGTVGEESAKHQHWKRRLNDIKNSREYQALSREIEQGERHVRGLEDKQLELGQWVQRASPHFPVTMRAMRVLNGATLPFRALLAPLARPFGDRRAARGGGTVVAQRPSWRVV